MEYALPVQERTNMVNERVRNLERQHFNTTLDLVGKQAEVNTANTPEAEAQANAVANYQKAVLNFEAGIKALKALLPLQA